MQTKLNGVPFQDMIIYHLSLDQVSTVVRLRFHDHVYIKLIKIHTKRMTTSNFAGRAAHDCKSAIFNVRRVVFELFTDTLGPVSSSKHSSTYRENKDTRNRNAIAPTLEIQLSISPVRDIPTGQLSRFSVSRAWLLNTVFIKPIKHRIVSDRIENSANGPSGSEHLS